MSWIVNRPLRIVIWWQIIFVSVSALVLGFAIDFHAAISALLGGSVSIASAIGFAIMVSMHKGYTASSTIRTALRAEAVKIIITVIFLWLVFTVYKEMNAFVFIGMFVVTVLVNSMALLVSDNKQSAQIK